MLRERSLAKVDLHKQRRAAEMAESTIGNDVTSHWMEWQGGSPRLTTTGENLCKYLKALPYRTGMRPVR